MGWLSNWAYRAIYQIDHTKVDAALTHFPVHLKISDSSGATGVDLTPIFDELGAEKFKIAVTTTDGTQLYVEVVNWDSINELAELWVSKLGWVISADVDTFLFIYFDASKPDNTTYVGLHASAVAALVWDSYFKLVDHMQDYGDTAHTIDSTSNNNDGVKTGANEPAETTGIIGKAQSWDGINDVLTYLDTPSLSPSTELTITFWLYCDGNYFGIEKSSSYYVYNNGGTFCAARCYNDPAGFISINKAGLPDDNWHYFQYTYKKNDVQLLAVDFTSDTEAVTSNIVDNANSLLIGQLFGSKRAGIMDEFHLSFAARSAAWRKASYYTGLDQLGSYGGIEECPIVYQEAVLEAKELSACYQ